MPLLSRPSLCLPPSTLPHFLFTTREMTSHTFILETQAPSS